MIISHLPPILGVGYNSEQSYTKDNSIFRKAIAVSTKLPLMIILHFKLKWIMGIEFPCFIDMKTRESS